MIDTSKTGSSSKEIVKGIISRGIQVLGVLLFQGLILFLAAGTVAWVWAWVFLGIYTLSVIINSIFLFQTNPETIAERGNPKEFRKWDAVVSGVWGALQFLVIPLVAGLDFRFSWTKDLAAGWHIAGGLAFALGLGLFGWAMITNAYFSTAVRIQEDRGQRVCKDGPYRFVRHPGYAGTFLQSLGMPLLLGSLWALIPGILAVICMAVRAYLEDKTLQKELEGYQEYSQEVRFRLIPGIW
jgi:protein-S-isoprenylcysteine O-methyltransferase Ste14